MLFAAAQRAEGNARALFRLADRAGVELWSSAFAVDEARRNLRVKAFAAERELDRLLAAVRLAREPDPDAVAIANGFGVPVKDAPILAGAIAIGATALVTGDRRHFGALFEREVRAMAIELPARAVERFLAVVEGRRRPRRRR